MRLQQQEVPEPWQFPSSSELIDLFLPGAPREWWPEGPAKAAKDLQPSQVGNIIRSFLMWCSAGLGHFGGLQMAPAVQPKFIFFPQYHRELPCLDTRRSMGDVVATGRGPRALPPHGAVPVTLSREATASPAPNHGHTGDTSIPFATPAHCRGPRQPLEQQALGGWQSEIKGLFLADPFCYEGLFPWVSIKSASFLAVIKSRG